MQFLEKIIAQSIHIIAIDYNFSATKQQSFHVFLIVVQYFELEGHFRCGRAGQPVCDLKSSVSNILNWHAWAGLGHMHIYCSNALIFVDFDNIVFNNINYYDNIVFKSVNDCYWTLIFFYFSYTDILNLLVDQLEQKGLSIYRYKYM